MTLWSAAIPIFLATNTTTIFKNETDNDDTKKGLLTLLLNCIKVEPDRNLTQTRKVVIIITKP